MNSIFEKLSVGTAQFGMDYGIANQNGKVPLEEATKIVSTARDKNVKALDTAKDYGNCENVLGNIGVNGFQITTKTNLRALDAPNNLISELQHSVTQQIAVDKFTTADPWLAQLERSGIEQEKLEVLQLAKQMGLVSKIGVSVYDPEDLKVVKIDASRDNPNSDNINDDVLPPDNLLPEVSEARSGDHTRSAFLQGLLLMELEDLPKWTAPWYEHFVLLDDLSKKYGVSRLDLCCSFAFSFPEISRVVIGFDNAAHLLKLSEKLSTCKPGYARYCFGQNDRCKFD